MKSCIFCDIITSKKDHNILYEEEDFIIIEDIKPKSDVHLLAIPKLHIENLYHVRKRDHGMLGNIIMAMPKMAKLYRVRDGFKIIINNGKMANQEVNHLHFHFLGYKRRV